MKLSPWVLDKLLGKQMSRELRAHVSAMANAPERASRDRAAATLAVLAERPGPHVNVGETDGGQEISLPLPDLVRLHALITGGSGSGKTMAMLLIVNAMLACSEDFRFGCALIDGAKSDLFLGALYLVKRRLEELASADRAAASRLRRRVRIIDFAGPPATITPFNLLARWPDADPDAFAAHQVELLLDLVPDGDALKLAAAPLKTLVQILSAPEISGSVIDLIQVLDDEIRFADMLARCVDATLLDTVRRQFGSLSRSTKSALRRRLEVLTSSVNVARMFVGRTAPDFRRFQDDGCFVLVNCAGPNISGRLAQFLNTLVVSNFCRAVYARGNPEIPFVVIADESQHLFASQTMREHLQDAGRLSRRYGTYFWFITQNLSASVPDPRLLRLLHTNVGWTWSGRGDPADCAFLKPVMPVAGRRMRPRREAFEAPRFYTDAEERALLIEETANLPNRTAYFSWKGQLSEALRLRTAQLDIPQGRELETAVLSLRSDPTIGQRLSRTAYDQSIRAREVKASVSAGNVESSLEGAYRQNRVTRGSGNGGCRT